MDMGCSKCLGTTAEWNQGVSDSSRQDNKFEENAWLLRCREGGEDVLGQYGGREKLRGREKGILRQ